MSLRRRIRRVLAVLALDDESFAFICSYERTDCATGMDQSVPNCGGELVARLQSDEKDRRRKAKTW